MYFLTKIFIEIFHLIFLKPSGSAAALVEELSLLHKLSGWNMNLTWPSV